MGKIIQSYYGEDTSQKMDVNWQLNILAPTNPTYIGKRRLPNKEGAAKGSGNGLYTKDIFLPGMLWAKGFSRGPTAHCKIKSMDTSAAEALPGVRGVLRYDDAELIGYSFNSSHNGAPYKLISETSEFDDHIVGCVVCADTEEICDEALKLVKIDWDTSLVVNIDWKTASAANAPITNPEIASLAKTNIYSDVTNTLGDVDKAFTTADKIIEWTYDSQENCGTLIETTECVAQWQGENLEVWHRSQRNHQGIPNMAKLTGNNISKLIWHMPYQGAWFGSSIISYAAQLPAISAILSKRTGRPVKTKYDEHFYGGGTCYGTYKFKAGYMNDGTIVAVDMYVVTGGGQINYNDILCGTCIPNLRDREVKANINRGPMSVYRDGGQLAGPLNSVFNHVAAAMNKDPSSIIAQNMGAYGKNWAQWADFRKSKFLHPELDSYALVLAAAKKAMNWDAKWHAPGTNKLSNGRMHGLGFSQDFQWANMKRPACVNIMIKDDGTVNIECGCCSTGEGQRTAYCQVVAEELGVLYENVNLTGFTAPGLWVQHGGASVGTCSNVPSLVRAARKAKRMLLELACLTVPQGVNKTPINATFTPRAQGAAAFPNLTWDKLDVQGGYVFEKANPSNKKTVNQVVAPQWPNGIILDWRVEPVNVDDYTGGYDSQLAVARQVHMIEVEVDTDTGQVFVVKSVCVNDVGKAINPDTVNGQQYGGAGMAIGSSNFEEVIYDQQTGLAMNNNLLGYKLTLMNDYAFPDCTIIETQQGYSAYGLLGIGEDVGAVMVDCTVSAVYNATGKWVDSWPTTPDVVLRALGKG